MNKIYRCVYNESLGAWVAVSELAHARGKRTKGRLSKTLLAASLALVGVGGASSAFAIVDPDPTLEQYSQIIVDGVDNSVTLTQPMVSVGPVTDTSLPTYIAVAPSSIIPPSDSTVVVANGAQFNYSTLNATNDYSTTPFELMTPEEQVAYLEKNALDMIKTTKGHHGELEAAPVPVGVVQILDHGTFGAVDARAADGDTSINLAEGSLLKAEKLVVINPNTDTEEEINVATAHGIYAANQTGNVYVTIAGDITTAAPVKQLFDADQTIDPVTGQIVDVPVIDPATGEPVQVPVIVAGGGHGVYVDTLTKVGDLYPGDINPEIVVPNRDIQITQNGTSTITAGGAGIKAVADGTSNVTVTQNAGAKIIAGDGGIAAEAESGTVSVDVAGSIEAGGNGIHAHGAGPVNVVVQDTATITSGESGIHAQSSKGAVEVDMYGTLDAAGTGIHAHSGKGDVTVNTTGTITAHDGDGVHAHSSAGVITVKTGEDISATGFGIHAHSNVTGQDDVDSNGIVKVTTNNNITSGDTGIYARSGANIEIDATGNINAGAYPVNSDGTVTIDPDTESPIVPVGNGITARSSQGNVNIKANGNIEAKVDGIVASGAESVSVEMNGNITVGSKVFDSTGYKSGWDAEKGEYASYTAGTGISAHSTQDAFSIIANGDINSVLDGIAASGKIGGTITTSGNITSALGNGINTSSSSGDVTINNTANITVGGTGLAVDPGTGAISETTTFAILGGKANEQVTHSLGTITGNTYLGSGSDSFTASSGAIIGGIAMGTGSGGETATSDSDVLTLKGTTNISQLTYLNGDEGVATETVSSDIDRLNLGVDITGSSNTFMPMMLSEGLPLGTAGNVAIDNWEYINVLNGGTLRLSGDLLIPYSLENSPETYSLTIERGGTLALAEGTTSATIIGDVDNHGTIDLHSGDANPINTLTVLGKYTAGSDLIVDVNLATGESDLLEIVGPVTGTTHVTAYMGDVTATDSLKPVITVAVNDSTGGGTFVGTGITSNAGEGQLILTSAEGEPQTYGWTLDVNGKPIYKPEVSGYTQMPYANLMLGYEMLGTLHDRVGEQQTWAWDKCGTCQETQNNQVWGRIRGNNTELTGEKRLDMEADQFVAQVGYDFDVRYNPDTGSRRHTGAMMSYGRSSIDFFDRYRAENGLLAADKYTGKGTTDAASLGLYSTYYDKNGSYLDLVGHVSYLQNEYEARNGVNVDQDGWGAGISAEVGRPYKLGNSHWLIEPQAQLSYQYISLEDFNDGRAHVDQDDQHGLRGRVGARLAYNAPTADYRTKTFYAVANVLSDFIEPSDVKIGRNVLNEDYSRTWGEVGLGLQLPIAKSAYVYADARYQQELTDEDRNGYTGTIGLKHSW